MIAWSSKALSFAGRLQLLKSVISSTLNFWLSVFILPASCLRKIESLCRNYLWSGSPNESHKAKVAWQDVCTPLNEGGLGLRSLKHTSRIFSLNLIWKLFATKRSLWVAWTKKFLLRNNSFWDAKLTAKGSWIWRKLLKLRDEALPFMKVEINNGVDASFWSDNWCDAGRLIDKTGAAGVVQWGIRRNATVAEAVQSGIWLPHANRSRMFGDTLEVIRRSTIPMPDAGSDTYLWRHSVDNFRPFYSAKKTWEQIRTTIASVPWANAVWFKQGVPRYSFITWLATIDRLSTGARMRHWGFNQNCVLCDAVDESRNHLFFTCNYSSSVWSQVASTIYGTTFSHNWETTLATLSGSCNNITLSVLRKMIFQTVIYFVWRERNNRIHDKGKKTTTNLTWGINKAIRNRISSLNYKFPHRLECLMRSWLSYH